MRRVFVVVVGLALAMAAGLVFLAIGGLIVPATRELAADVSLGGIFALLSALAGSDAPDRLWSAVALAFWTLAAALIVVPPLVAAIVGEVAGLRSFVWYGGSAGVLTAAIAWLGHAASHGPDPPTTKLLLLLFLPAQLPDWSIGRLPGAARGKSPSRQGVSPAPEDP